ncbi:MAG: hypothetical protein ACTSP4_16010 [Candidatus Hodarchaeales archaeon]
MTETIVGALGNSFISNNMQENMVQENWGAFLKIISFLKSGCIKVIYEEKVIEIRNELASENSLEEFFLALLQLDIYDIRMVKRSKNYYRISIG